MWFRYIETQALLSNLGMHFAAPVSCRLPDGNWIEGRVCRLLPPAGYSKFDSDIRFDRAPHQVFA
jgi:hypothetical protein